MPKARLAEKVEIIDTIHNVITLAQRVNTISPFYKLIFGQIKAFELRKVNIRKGVWLHLPRKPGKNIPKFILNQGPPRASRPAYNEVHFNRMSFIKQDC